MADNAYITALRLSLSRYQAELLEIVDRRLPATAAAPAPDPVDDALVAALAQLGDEQREVVVLRFVADLSLDDVAAITAAT